MLILRHPGEYVAWDDYTPLEPQDVLREYLAFAVQQLTEDELSLLRSGALFGERIVQSRIGGERTLVASPELTNMVPITPLHQIRFGPRYASVHMFYQSSIFATVLDDDDSPVHYYGLSAILGSGASRPVGEGNVSYLSRRHMVSAWDEDFYGHVRATGSEAPPRSDIGEYLQTPYDTGKLTFPRLFSGLRVVGVPRSRDTTRYQAIRSGMYYDAEDRVIVAPRHYTAVPLTLFGLAHMIHLYATLPSLKAVSDVVRRARTSYVPDSELLVLRDMQTIPYGENEDPYSGGRAGYEAHALTNTLRIRDFVSSDAGVELITRLRTEPITLELSREEANQ